MGTKYRKRVVPYAIYITLLQLLQMLVGFRHREGRDVSGGWRGVPREQDKLNLGFDDVCQLLRPLLQAVCGQLLLEAEESQEAALREGCHEVSEPKDHSSH